MCRGGGGLWEEGFVTVSTMRLFRCICLSFPTCPTLLRHTGEVQGVGGGGGGPAYDVERMVAMDVPGGGTQTLPLNFNLGDDPGTVARNFVTEHGLPIHNYEQVNVMNLE